MCARYFAAGAVRPSSLLTTALRGLEISVRQLYKQPKTDLFAAKLNAYSPPPPVTGDFGSLYSVPQFLSSQFPTPL